MVRKWSSRHLDHDSPSESWRDLCPVCRRSDHVEKVSTVVHHNSGSLIMGHSAYPYISNLALMLTLPEPPKVPDSESLLHRVLLAWFAATVGALFIFALQAQSQVDLPHRLLTMAMAAIVTGFAFLLPLGLGLAFSLQTRRANILTPAWLNTKQRWSRLLYCSWDDVIFVRGTDEYEAPENMGELLARPAPPPPSPSPAAVDAVQPATSIAM